MRILIVDDDPVICALLRLFLESEGYRPSVAKHGQDALDRLAIDDKFALVLLDIMMPVLDGWGFLAIREQDARLVRIPVVVMTAKHDVDPQHLGRLGVSGLLPKPFGLDELIGIIETCRRRTDDEAVA